MMAAMEKLTKTVEEKDMQIAELKSMLDAQLEEDSTKGPHENDKEKEKQVETSEQRSKTTEGQQSSLGSLTVQQL